MFLPCPEITATDADRNWVRRQLNQLALEQGLPDEVYARFSSAIDHATWRSELQDLADRLPGNPGRGFPTIPV